MAKQETMLAKKRRGPAPTGKGQQVVVRMHSTDLELLDLWIAANPDPVAGPLTRPEAMRRILRLVAMRVPSGLERSTSNDWMESFDHADD